MANDVYIGNIKPGANQEDLIKFLKKGVEITDDAIEKIVFREQSAIISFKERGVAERVVCLNGLPWNGDPAEEKKVFISWAPPALPAHPPASLSLALSKRRKWLRTILVGLAIFSIAVIVFFLLSQFKGVGVESPEQTSQPTKQNLDKKLQQMDKQLKELEQLLDE